jgi:hypothetical protein
MGLQRDPAREQFWRDTVAAWQRSGQTIRGFCASRRLSEASLYAWRRELAWRDRQRGSGAAPSARRPSPAAPAKFIPLQVVASALIEVVLPTGVVIRLPSGADAASVASVARLVAALEAGSC